MAKNNATTKGTRKGSQRGKTGCPTCRQVTYLTLHASGGLCSEADKCYRARHVKCDERRPFCLNCTSTGRKCDGYECVKSLSHQQTTSSPGLARLITSMMSPWSDSQVALAPTLGLSANEQSNRFFHSFLHDCVPVLTETMDSEFWRRGILRASSSPAVQHAAIAFGAVYEQRVANDGRLASSPNGKRLGLLSSSCYANAIRILRYYGSIFSFLLITFS